MSSPDKGESSEATAVLGDDLIRVVKLLHAVRDHAPRRHPDVDTSAYPLLFQLKDGPLRLSELAPRIHAEVSTVSRQVAALVDLSLIARGPDPDDGRAQALSLTPAGEELLVAIRNGRDRWLRGLLVQWSPADIETFSHHLQRFAAELDADLMDKTRRTDS